MLFHANRIKIGPIMWALEEDLAIGRRIQAGDEAAVAEMVERHTAFALAVAKPFARRNPHHADDIRALAMVGALTAARKYDPARGLKFNTYAVAWIRQAIIRYLKEEGGIVHRPSKAKLPEAPVIGLDEPLSEDGPSLSKFMAQTMFPDGESVVAAQERSARARALLARLPAKHAAVLRMRFGIDGEDERTFIEISPRLGLSRERIRQIEREALHILRRAAANLPIRNAAMRPAGARVAAVNPPPMTKVYKRNYSPAAIEAMRARGRRRRGLRHSPETIEKMRAAARKRRMPDEVKEKIRRALSRPGVYRGDNAKRSASMLAYWRSVRESRLTAPLAASASESSAAR